MNIPECQKTADVCKALGDYQRVMIVRSLMEGEKTTDELVELLWSTTSASWRGRASSTGRSATATSSIPSDPTRFR